MARGTILIVEDERAIADLLRAYLEREGYRVRTAARGDEGLAMALQEPPDLMILDLLLPGMPGMEVCRRVRAAADVPVIMVTARSTEADKLAGLGGGADDYVTKPFSPAEVVARVGAVLRRVQGRGQAAASASLRAGPIRLEPDRHEAFVGDRALALTPAEFRLLEVLMRHPGRAFTRGELCDLVLGPDFAGFDRNIDVHVMRLRRKLALDPSPIVTVFGVGYKFQRPDREAPAGSPGGSRP
jgi:DNA-binding response OmpR family regulator